MWKWKNSGKNTWNKQKYKFVKIVKGFKKRKTEKYCKNRKAMVKTCKKKEQCGICKK